MLQPTDVVQRLTAGISSPDGMVKAMLGTAWLDISRPCLLGTVQFGKVCFPFFLYVLPVICERVSVERQSEEDAETYSVVFQNTNFQLKSRCLYDQARIFFLSRSEQI